MKLVQANVNCDLPHLSVFTTIQPNKYYPISEAHNIIAIWVRLHCIIAIRYALYCIIANILTQYNVLHTNFDFSINLNHFPPLIRLELPPLPFKSTHRRHRRP